MSQAESAKRAKSALQRILSKLGLTDIYDSTVVGSYAPFDFQKWRNDALIDATTRMTIPGHHHCPDVGLVNALRMGSHVLPAKAGIFDHSLGDSTKRFHMGTEELFRLG